MNDKVVLIPGGSSGHGNPHEAADAIFWSSYVTGHTLIADGGMTAYAR